jgi:hypothetical protein
MKKYCLEPRSRGISYMKQVNRRLTGVVTFCVRNCLLKRVTEGKIQGRIELTGRQVKDVESYWMTFRKKRGFAHLKEEALDRTVWRAHFGRGFGPVVRHTTK